MLDLATLERIELTSKPKIQRVIAWSFLFPNYAILPGVQIELDGFEQVPDHPVIYAMNHTDRYNYWPFQFSIYRRATRYTATWVKGKYYEHPALAKFMELTNNIPTVSRGFLVSKDFALTMRRAPTGDEYETLRRWVDAAASDPTARVDASAIPEPVLTEARDVLGRAFRPDRESYAEYVNGLFRAMMARFVALNAQAFERGLDMLIFPQGTRSIRLSKGHVGLAQIALKFRRTIVPVGCNGSDKLYPTGNPWAKKGRVVYRFGKPISHEELREFHVADYEPFTPEAESRYAAEFRGVTDLVMSRIDGLLDDEYRFSDDQSSDGVAGAGRFI